MPFGVVIQSRILFEAFTWSKGGWCQLYSGCNTLEYAQHIVSYRRANPTTPALLQLNDHTVESYGPHAELASSFPYVILNLSNFSGLVNNESHPRIQHRFGNATSDLNLFYEKVEGFYIILHEARPQEATTVKGLGFRCLVEGVLRSRNRWEKMAPNTALFVPGCMCQLASPSPPACFSPRCRSTSPCTSIRASWSKPPGLRRSRGRS